MPEGNDSGVPFLEEAEIRIREYLELEVEERDELLLCVIWVGWTGRGCGLVVCRRHLSVGAEPKIQILKRTATCRGCSGHYHRSPTISMLHMVLLNVINYTAYTHVVVD